jgi:hypothetical protein
MKIDSSASDIATCSLKKKLRISSLVVTRSGIQIGLGCEDSQPRSLLDEGLGK